MSGWWRGPRAGVGRPLTPARARRHSRGCRRGGRFPATMRPWTPRQAPRGPRGGTIHARAPSPPIQAAGDAPAADTAERGHPRAGRLLGGDRRADPARPVRRRYRERDLGPRMGAVRPARPPLPAGRRAGRDAAGPRLPGAAHPAAGGATRGLLGAMGEQKVRRTREAEESRVFTRKLLADLHALEVLLAEGAIESGRPRMGAEQELFLVDARWQPAPVALDLLADLADPHFTTEL